MARLAGNSVDASLWILRPAACSTANCRAFARLARQLVGLRGALHRLVGRIAGSAVEQIRGEGFEARMARALAAKVPLPADRPLTEVVRCLRALGILCCLSSNRDLTSCRCLLDFAKEFGMDAAKRDLEARLRELAQPEAWPSAVA